MRAGAFVRACACVRVRARAGACVCVCVCVRACERGVQLFSVGISQQHLSCAFLKGASIANFSRDGLQLFCAGISEQRLSCALPEGRRHRQFSMGRFAVCFR